MSTPRITAMVRVDNGVITKAAPVWRKWVGTRWDNWPVLHYADRVEELT